MTKGNELRSAPNMEGPPAGYFLVVPPADDEEAKDAIDLAKTAAMLRTYWKLLLCMTLVCGIIAAGISLWMRNVYRAQAIIAPTAESNGAGGSMKSDLGGLAALAGIDLGASGGRKVEALATLQSAGFIRDFIVKYNLLPILYSERWDANANTWRKDKTPPTMEKAIKRFKGRRIVDENTKSGLVTVKFDWYSPELAAQWTNAMIDMVNERMRAADIHTAESSLEYLDKEMATANTVELRLAIAQLIETQENNKMMANVQRDYAYHFIDRAVPPETKEGPLRTVISIGGALVGFLLGTAFVVFRRRAAHLPRAA
jgi:uncharacterized protein involved in exopolysaccharide biosynthesis